MVLYYFPFLQKKEINMPNQLLALTQDQRQIQILAPQLRQSLELLQVPMLELRMLIQNELQQNPTLEEKPAAAEERAGANDNSLASPPDDSLATDKPEPDLKEELASLSRLDEEWWRYFTQAHEQEPYNPEAEQRRRHFMDSQVQKKSLQEHLRQQLALADISEPGRRIGALIIGSINNDGYLTQDITDLAASAGLDPIEMNDVLTLIQDFDPVGIGARDLRECLLLQLERLGQGDSVAAAIARDHLEALGNKHLKEIAQGLKLPLAAVQEAARLIATLEPKPGRAFSAESPYYILPDVFVEKIEGQYHVFLNNAEIPSLRISRHYQDLLRNAQTPADAKAYIQERIRSGLLLIKSIDQRKQTMRKVASAIVAAQTEFMDQGIAALKPLTMAEVAQAVGLHETTISRCIANKHIQTPRGLFELKYFFTPGLKTIDGQAISNKTVQDTIVNLISSEDLLHPLSDQVIQEKLKAQGINIARRTVAKYRIALKILPSHLRKSS